MTFTSEARTRLVLCLVWNPFWLSFATHILQSTLCWLHLATRSLVSDRRSLSLCYFILLHSSPERLKEMLSNMHLSFWFRWYNESSLSRLEWNQSVRPFPRWRFTFIRFSIETIHGWASRQDCAGCCCRWCICTEIVVVFPSVTPIE